MGTGMSEKNENEGKLTLRRPGRLELKKTVESGQVRQSFSHGRSKAVTVEVKKKRTFERGEGGRMEAVRESDKAITAAEQSGLAEAEVSTLTEEERAARIRALKGAAHDNELRQLAEVEETRAREQEEEIRKRSEEDDARRRSEEETRRRTEEESRRKAGEIAEAPGLARTEGRRPERKADALSPAGRRRTETERERTPPPRSRQDPRRRAGKLTISQALDAADGDGNQEERVRSLAALKRARERERQRAREQRASGETQMIVREVVIPEAITVSDLANRMAVRGIDVIKSLMKLDIMATIHQLVDADTAELIVNEFGHKVKRVSESDVEVGIAGEEDPEATLTPRAPVVTIMGHVDHGKTSLLDALRETDVAAGESGGITQHIGAYQVELTGGQHITFLDTPGHEAFTQMRSRGAQVTDIVVLVVAADDGVQPQTDEAINHAKVAGVPMIIAINKIDRPDANPDKVRNELLSHELVVEKLGGDILDVEVSATERTNLDKLEEVILLQAEILELKTNADRPAQGTVIEAKLEQGRGPVATVLVQRGTLRPGDVFIAGPEWGRVRALADDRGNPIEEAGPSVPVEVLGLQGTPSAGDDFTVVEDEARAREITDYRKRTERSKALALSGRGTLEQMFDQIKAGEAAELPVVVRGDVQGSVEAIIGALDKISTEEVKVNVLHSAVGGVTESDVTLAGSVGGVIIGFNVRANPQARDLARRDQVDIRYYSVIYDVIDDMKGLLSGMLAPEVRETQTGYAEIREVFGITKGSNAAGCMVTEGNVRRGNMVRLLRDDVVIYEGSLKTLRRFKDDVREVQQGYECGMSFENYDDIKEGDVVECFETEEVARTL